MRLILISFISAIAICANAIDGTAQIERFIPSHVRIGYDLGGMANTLLSDQLDYHDFIIDTDINKFLFNVEYGNATFQANNLYINYKSTGNYFRLGLDYNFMYDSKDFNALFFGFRYATSTFDEEVQYPSQNAIQMDTRWPVDTFNIGNNGVNAGWVEANLGLRVRVWNNFYMGMTVRYKIKPWVNKSSDGTLVPFYVPGFGKDLNSDRWNLAYFIAYRIPFRKKKVYEEDISNKE